MVKFLFKIYYKIYLKFFNSSEFKIKNSNGLVIISYVLFPKFLLKKFLKYHTHNNILHVYSMVKYFNSKGYDVKLFNHNYVKLKERKPEIFIGHTHTFEILKNKIDPKTSYLLLTGASPEFTNKLTLKRNFENLQKFKIDDEIYTDNINISRNHSIKIADHVILMGNSFIKETYEKIFFKKFHLINNIYNPILNKKLENKRNDNFLFFSSTGQIHRGLDLILRSALKFPNSNFYILSNYKEEKAFIKNYEYFFNRKNIKAVGFLNITSKRFNEIVDNCSFTILPTLSEGQSSSILNLLAMNRIPITNYNSGVNNINEMGILIKELTLEEIENSISIALNLTNDEFDEKLFFIKKYKEDYSMKQFKESLKYIF